MLLWTENPGRKRCFSRENMCCTLSSPGSHTVPGVPRRSAWWEAAFQESCSQGRHSAIHGAGLVAQHIMLPVPVSDVTPLLHIQLPADVQSGRWQVNAQARGSLPLGGRPGSDSWAPLLTAPREGKQQVKGLLICIYHHLSLSDKIIQKF